MLYFRRIFTDMYDIMDYVLIILIAWVIIRLPSLHRQRLRIVRRTCVKMHPMAGTNSHPLTTCNFHAPNSLRLFFTSSSYIRISILSKYDSILFYFSPSTEQKVKRCFVLPNHVVFANDPPVYDLRIQ